MSYIQPATLYLNSDGSSFELKCHADGTFRSVDFEKDNVHPLLQHAVTCRTHQSALDFLNSLGEQEDCLRSVTLMHEHNFAYPGHAIIKGVAHPESLEDMKDFVALRMKDIEEGTTPAQYFTLMNDCALL